MANVFLCPACKATIAADETIGEEVHCPICGAFVMVSIDDPRPPIEVRTASSGLAVGSLACAVLGVVTCMPPLGIVAIILGIKASNLAKQHPQRYDGAHFARSAIIVGIIGIITAASVGTFVLLAVRRSRELERRTMCMANLRGFSGTLYIYAQDPPFLFPMASGVRTENDGAFVAFDQQMRLDGPTKNDPPSPSADLWLLVRTFECTPRCFVCPSTTDKIDATDNVEDYYDFQSPNNLSYSYHYQHDPDHEPIGTSSELWFPVFADANPYIKGGVTSDFAADRTSRSQGNSLNHGRDGQNVFYQDGHVAFETSPDTGTWTRPPYPHTSRRLSSENMYTTHKPGGSFDPGDAAPTLVGTRGTCNLGSKSDACLIP